MVVFLIISVPPLGQGYCITTVSTPGNEAVPGSVGADHEKAFSLIEMAEEGTGRFAHVFVPLG